uniref:Protein NATD1 n=2 Tax=Dicentrarchus labrax TaxID=13489 RepID=A0A8P4KCQ9_DICLA
MKLFPQYLNAACETLTVAFIIWFQTSLSLNSVSFLYSCNVILYLCVLYYNNPPPSSLTTPALIGWMSPDLTADLATMAQAAQANAFDPNTSQIQVEHDKKRRQFVIRLNGSHDRAVLLYEYVGKKTVDLQHTEVPDAYRGRGIAKHLAKAAMDFVVEEDLKAHLTCWYIQKYVKENPQPQYFEHIYQ